MIKTKGQIPLSIRTRLKDGSHVTVTCPLSPTQHQLLGLFYIPTIAIPSITSPLGLNGGIDHLDRWFEVDASRRGALYFDKKYGRGNKGYAVGNKRDYFDINSFVTNKNSPYINPRTNSTDHRQKFPIDGNNTVFWDYFWGITTNTWFPSLLLKFYL